MPGYLLLFLKQARKHDCDIHKQTAKGAEENEINLIQVFTSASTVKRAHNLVSRTSITPFKIVNPKPRIMSTISRK